MLKGTNNHEPASCETLYMSPSWTPEHTSWQNVAIGSLEKDFLSMAFIRGYDDFENSYCHMWFTREEVDLLIKAMQEMKDRWDHWDEYKKKVEDER